MKYTGILRSTASAASTPPLAVPSSLVMIRPVKPMASSKALTCASAFCPILPSSTRMISCGAPSRALFATRLTFFSSSIRCNCVGRRPAVSAITTSNCLACAEAIASNTTAAGSPDSCAITVTLLRSPQTASCSRAAARKVSPAARMTFLPIACKWCVSLPILVVLPAPFTPATISTSGRWPSISSSFSSGCNNSVSTCLSAARTPCASSMRSFLIFARSACMICSVALTPTSAISKASSSDSNSASSTFTPMNTWRKFVPVLLSPARRRAIQPRCENSCALGLSWVSGCGAMLLTGSGSAGICASSLSIARVKISPRFTAGSAGVSMCSIGAKASVAFGSAGCCGSTDATDATDAAGASIAGSTMASTTVSA